MTEAEIKRRAIALFDRYTHETPNRRAFLAEMTKLAGSAAAASALTATIAPSAAAAALIDPKDARLVTGRINWPDSRGQAMSGYMARPKASRGKLASVMVIHENRGLNSYIKDVARRAAIAGFVALAPDFLSPLGETPSGEEDKARDMIGTLDLPYAVANGVTAIGHLRKARMSNGKVGAIGFCWGGAMVNRLAVAGGDRLDAGVAFYGPAPNPSEAEKVKAPLQLHYAGNDDRVNTGAGPWVAALRKAGVRVQRFDYPGTEHAFHNDTSAARYNAEAARLAWDRALAFFREHLG
jgi:carboxymethylenebutenolidase